MLQATKELDPMELNAGDALYWRTKYGAYGDRKFSIPSRLFARNKFTFGFRKAIKEHLIAGDSDKRYLLPYIETAIRAQYGQTKNEICDKLQLGADRIRSIKIVDYNMYKFGEFVKDENNLTLFYECKEIFEQYWIDKI